MTATNRLYELVDGTLVEKAMGFDESISAFFLAGDLLIDYLKTHDLGKAVGADGHDAALPRPGADPRRGLHLVGALSQEEAAARGDPDARADLVVEVLSKGNTRKEMARKLREYFKAGVRLVWYVDPSKRTVRVYTAVDRSTLLARIHTLDGGDVLPGFSLSIRDWFAEAERTGAAAAVGTKRVADLARPVYCQGCRLRR